MIPYPGSRSLIKGYFHLKIPLYAWLSIHSGLMVCFLPSSSYFLASSILQKVISVVHTLSSENSSQKRMMHTSFLVGADIFSFPQLAALPIRFHQSATIVTSLLLSPQQAGSLFLLLPGLHRFGFNPAYCLILIFSHSTSFPPYNPKF